MPEPTYYHMKAVDYPIRFPGALDVVPVLIQKRTYIDDWIYIRMYAIITNIETYLIANREHIEA